MATKKRDQYEELPPDPAATIESLRSLGYSPESAIADLIDNSIAAGAQTVHVRLHWSGPQSWCAVLDDGCGMNDVVLRQAMRIGSRDPLAERAESDLGRFGLGLKTASFSQARELTVLSRTGRSRSPHVRCWDLDHVRAVGRWDLRRVAPEDAAALLRDLDSGKPGTVVLWRRLDQLVDPDTWPDDRDAERLFLDRIDAIHRHLAMTFARFLAYRTTPLTLTINSRPVQAWDAFLVDVPATQQLAEEKLVLKRHTVVVRPYVLPHQSKLTDVEYERAAGPLGWNGQQGFYVYRNDRLIVSGDWLGMGFTRDDAHNLARIAVDVPSALDREWSLDVTKGTVRPPTGLRDDLKRVAKETRRRARAVVHHRGAPVGRTTRRGVVPVWLQRRRHGELVFRINRSHPAIADLGERLADRRREVQSVLDLIEETLPVPALPVAPAVARRAFEDKPPDELVELGAMLYESFLRLGLSRKEAAARLLQTEPFDEYADLLAAIWRTR